MPLASTLNKIRPTEHRNGKVLRSQKALQHTNSTQGPASQLRELLKLDNNDPNHIRDIYNDIKRIGEKYLKIELCPAVQAEKLIFVRKEVCTYFMFQVYSPLIACFQQLVEKYPNTFNKQDSEIRLCLAEPAHETLQKLSGLRRGTTVDRKPILQETVSFSSSSKNPTNSNGYRDYIVPTRFSNEPGPSTETDTAGGIPSSPQTLWTTPSRRSNNASRSSIGSMPCTPSSSHGGDAIYHFLDSCLPSMAHLWEDFDAYGLNDEQMLLAVSSWTPEHINSFLHRFANKCRKPVSEMDIEMLQVHFLSYFKGG
ncbi:hypothetical protein JR316_0009307 [Psilocybe cubensis]|uniref:Uncharacterized protein n=1 Tax=Psilocybe cubensis TaxID=181762 RepID=A0ACB8GTP8_PSICU|nr:hypothetical protein JR316_0009307 [Psilocybe cubensis]KAH9478845.1 hypothetical protein JR316_0009307 [Psilocybe cubensis]